MKKKLVDLVSKNFVSFLQKQKGAVSLNDKKGFFANKSSYKLLTAIILL